MFLCCRVDIVKILCSGWRHPWRRSNGFCIEHHCKFKSGGCFGFSAEESSEKMKSSWKSALRVMVSDGVIRGFLLIFINAAVKYFAVAIIMSVVVEVGMMNFWGNQEILCSMRTELVAGIKI